MKKQLIKYTLPLFIALGFSACGGGGGGGSDAYFENIQNQIVINVQCITDPTLLEIENYITLYSGDTITRSSGDVTIVTYHNIDGTKKVCQADLSTGSAYILR